MVNLTITVDDGTLKRARMRALEEDTYLGERGLAGVFGRVRWEKAGAVGGGA